MQVKCPRSEIAFADGAKPAKTPNGESEPGGSIATRTRPKGSVNGPRLAARHGQVSRPETNEPESRPMYRVEYYCPREAPYWQPYGTGDFTAAMQTCKRLVFQYHSARVIDPMGNVIYQV